MFKLGEVQSTDTWGPGDEWQLEGALKDVPFAPFSKGDKLGRAADWTSENKDGRDPRSRQGYNRNYRGPLIPFRFLAKSDKQINIKRMERVQHHHSHINMAKMKPRSQSSIIAPCLNHEHTIVLEMPSADVVAPNAVEEDNFKDLVAVEVAVVAINKADDGGQVSVAADSAGKITINHNVFVMQVSKSNRNGNYLKKLNSIDFQNWL